jgi:integrase
MPTRRPSNADEQRETNRILARLFLKHLRAKNRRPSTVYTYQAFLLYHFLPWVDARALDALTLWDLEEFIGRTREWSRAEGAPATRKRETSMIKTTYAWLHAREMLRYNPAAPLEGPSVPPRRPRAISDEVWINTWSQDMPLAVRVAIGLAFYGGLRRVEVIKLRRHQVDVEQMELRNFARKGGGEDVLPLGLLLQFLSEGFARAGLPRVAFAEEFTQALDALCRERTQGQPLMPWGDRRAAPPAAVARHGLDRDMGDPQHFTKAVSLLGKRIGYPLSPHMFRHSFVTNLLRAGVRVETVSAMANHADLGTTSTYIRSGKSELAEQLRVLVSDLDINWMAGPRHRPQ